DEIPRPPAGNLMADLHAKLSMRRRGISGQRDGGNESAIMKLMDKPLPSLKDSETEDNSDWDES
ncbi:hypothetical protein LSTR_LSTR015182, partial [Laodelphax striatellus]